MPARIEYKKGDKLGPYNIEFVEEIEPYVKQSGKKDRKGKFICPECGIIFEARISHIKSGNTKSCRCVQRKTRIENGKKTGKINGKKSYKDLTGKRFGKLVVLEKTEKRSGRNIIWKTKCDCGNIAYISEASLVCKGTRSCGCNKKSHGEEKIKIFLQSLNVSFETQKTFNKCKNPETNMPLRFDFYLPDYNCCIEYDGVQHFKSIDFFGGEERFKYTQLLDLIKNQYCKDNNIKLIRIPYWDYDNIENILNKVINDE